MLQNPRLRSVPTRRTLFATLVTTLVLATPLVAATPTNTALEPAQFPDRAEYRGLWMDRNTFQDLLKNVPEFTQNLVRMLSGRLRMANEQIQSLSSLDVAGRLARQILAFAERYGQDEPGQGTRIPLRLTQSDLAELVGASRERVNQVMVDFRQKNYLAVDSSHRILVHKAQELTRLCK